MYKCHRKQQKSQYIHFSNRFRPTLEQTDDVWIQSDSAGLLRSVRTHLVLSVTGKVGGSEGGVAIHPEGADGVTAACGMLFIYGMYSSSICSTTV